MKEMQKTQFPSLGRGDPPEEEMTTHSIILAWKVLWMEEPVGYSPWGRKEPDTQTHTHTHTTREPQGKSNTTKQTCVGGVLVFLTLVWS